MTSGSFVKVTYSTYSICSKTPANSMLPSFKRASTHILRGFYSIATLIDIGINTASSCDGPSGTKHVGPSQDEPTCFVPDLVAGSASISLT